MAGKKTTGKKAPEKKPTAKAATKEKRTDGIFLDRVPEKYIDWSEDKKYARVAFLKDGQRHSFLVNPGQVIDIKKKDSDEIVKNVKSILVGYPDGKPIEVSCNVADKDGNFPPRFEMSAADIKKCYDSAGEKIRANKKEKKAERETPEVAEAAAAEAQAEK